VDELPLIFIDSSNNLDTSSLISTEELGLASPHHGRSTLVLTPSNQLCYHCKRALRSDLTEVNRRKHRFSEVQSVEPRVTYCHVPPALGEQVLFFRQARGIAHYSPISPILSRHRSPSLPVLMNRNDEGAPHPLHLLSMRSTAWRSCPPASCSSLCSASTARSSVRRRR
jgi:hypothetical protein